MASDNGERAGDRRHKPVRLSNHAAGYLSRRGFTEAEVVETIRAGDWILTRAERWETARDFPYQEDWNGTFYTTKRVRPIFVDEPSEIVVVTVYTYFFSA
jgi:Domain of unknown function (DUF4258)